MDKYQYCSLKDFRQIRLLKLHAGAEADELSGELVHTSLDEAPAFIALSYTWGNSNTRDRFCCSGLKLEIGPNLHSALQHLRQPNSETLFWADAICINQEDILERSQQVKMMSEIYAAASATAIWLGKESGEIKMAFGWLRRFGMAQGSSDSDQLLSKDDESFITKERAKKTVQEAFGKHRASAFRHIWALLDCLWFTRKWVIQELVMSKKPIMVAGRIALPWALLANWIDFVEWCPYLKEIFMRLWPQPTKVDTKVLGTSMLRAALLTRIAVQEKQTLMFLIVKTLEFRCADPRDHIFAMVGIASDSDHFDLIDYGSPTEMVCRQLAYTCVSDCMRLKLLWSLSFLTPLARRVRSWVPNVETVAAERDGGILATMFTVQQYRDYNASGNSVLQTSLEDDGNLLNIRGRIVDRIQLRGSDNRRLGDARITKGLVNSDVHLYRQNVQKMLRQRCLWLEECLAIAKRMNTANHEEAFRNALLGDSLIDKEVHQSLAVVKHELSTQLRLYRAMAYENDHNSWLSAVMESFSMKSSLLLESMIMEKLHRRFGGTENKRLGWLPPMAEMGDLICIFDGMELPYAIRPAGNGRYSLIGECIFPGLMMGEVMELTHIVSRVIVLE